MTVFAFVGQEESDIQGHQSRFVERQRAFDIAHSQNGLVESHRALDHVYADGLNF